MSFNNKGFLAINQASWAVIITSIATPSSPSKNPKKRSMFLSIVCRLSRPTTDINNPPYLYKKELPLSPPTYQIHTHSHNTKLRKKPLHLVAIQHASHKTNSFEFKISCFEYV